MKLAGRLMFATVVVLTFVSSIAVVWSKYQSRATFVQLQKLQAERDKLDIEWGQLKIEQSYWSTPGRVEQAALTQLQMYTPSPSEVRIVQSQQVH